MSDFLLNLAQNRGARNVIKSLGLPVPLPPQLRRPLTPWRERPLDGLAAKLEGTGPVHDRLVDVIEQAGADLRPHPDSRLQALVLDATTMKTTADLSGLYEFFHPLLPSLDRNGRCVVVGRPPDTCKGEAAAVAAALEGFVKSLAKEVGGRGATANLLWVHNGAEARVEGPLRFVLSERSAFVSGQPLRVGKSVKGTLPKAWLEPHAGKVALVTGAARGIGADTAETLAREGAHVVCLDRPEDESLLREVANRVGGSTLGVDVTDPSAAARIVEFLQREHDGVDIVVHNAGITRDKTLLKMPAEDWDLVLAVNLRAITNITPALLEGTLREGGRIVCLSSIGGIAGNFGQTNYAATKSGVIGYVRAMAPELAKQGITINAVAPGFIETRLTAMIPMVMREVGRRMNALSQGGLPEDIAEAVSFLSSPDAAGVTGAVLRVCGLNMVGA